MSPRCIFFVYGEREIKQNINFRTPYGLDVVDANCLGDRFYWDK